jgi:DNA sulfur modification protein DndC
MLATELSEAQFREHEAQAVLRGLLERGSPLLVGYSGGKDSTIALALTLNAALDLKRSGGVVPPILVTHGDTGIENPTVSALAMAEMEKVRRFGARHGLTVRADVARPALNDTWAVSVLSGRKLPTFANSSSRDCTIGYKIQPMVKLRKHLLAAYGKQAARPVTVIGTRFEESTGRAERMNERKESAFEPWEKDGALFISPIALWSSDDVWESLGRMRSGDMQAFTDAADVFDLYAAGGGSSCAVVADMATESAKKSRACGARFGCSLCAAVGRDKSLENMLEADPGYAWLRGLNNIQRFLVDSQYDFDRRAWLGRTLDKDGFLPVTPDTYSPAMLKELLRYCLTADADEVRASKQAGVKPRFELVSPEALVAIDALWGLHGIAERPFAAVQVWLDVHVNGARYYPPKNVVAYPVRGFPAPRFIAVGEKWDQGDIGEYSGLRDLGAELAAREATPNRTLPDGRELLQLRESALFEVDSEGAATFLAWEAERKVAETGHSAAAGTISFFYYAQLEVLATSARHAGMLDAIVRRTRWKQREGLAGPVPAAKVKAMALSKEERDRQAGQCPTAENLFVGPTFPVPLRMRLCRPAYI